LFAPGAAAPLWVENIPGADDGYKAALKSLPIAATMNGIATVVSGMKMDRPTKFMIVGLIAVAAACLCGPAQAAPPTVTPSPGYDARLQESRKATANPVAAQSDQSSTPAGAQVAPHHAVRRKHAH